MLQLVVELVPCLLGGLWLGRRLPDLPERIAPALMRWGVPLSLVGLILKGGLNSGTLQAALFSLVLTSTGLMVTRQWPQLSRALPARSLQLGAVVGNTAYFGLPVAIALLPAAALSFRQASASIEYAHRQCHHRGRHRLVFGAMVEPHLSTLAGRAISKVASDGHLVDLWISAAFTNPFQSTAGHAMETELRIKH